MDKAGLALEARLRSAQPHDTFEVNIFLRGDPARHLLTGFADNARALSAELGARSIEAIKAETLAGQRPLLEFLENREREIGFTDGVSATPQVYRPHTFWINNAVGAELSLDLLQRVLERDDVTHVELNRHAPVEELIDVEPAGADGHTDYVARRTRPSPGRADGAADADTATWSVKRVNAPLLWQRGITGDGIVVAVVDTGVNYKHPDLAARMWVPELGADRKKYPKHGYDFWSDDNDPFDQSGAPGAGHGTSCAGQVAGDGTLGTMTGVAPGARIMAIRVGGSEDQFWKGLQFAIDRGAHVISMSMTWKYPSSPNYPGWRRTCETILVAGLLHANSTGNQGGDLTTFPLPYNIATPGNCPPPRLHPLQLQVGGLSSPISCGATDDADRLAWYSGRGPAAWEVGPYTDYVYQGGALPGLIKPDVCAPGPGTTSCNYLYGELSGAKPYSEFGGTSSATPHVAGCLALLAHACRRAGQRVDPIRIQEAIEATATRITGQMQEKENHFGAGRIDVYAAFKYGETRGWW